MTFAPVVPRQRIKIKAANRKIKIIPKSCGLAGRFWRAGIVNRYWLKNIIMVWMITSSFIGGGSQLHERVGVTLLGLTAYWSWCLFLAERIRAGLVSQPGSFQKTLKYYSDQG
jgi:hypothetical protein